MKPVWVEFRCQQCNAMVKRRFIRRRLFRMCTNCQVKRSNKGYTSGGNWIVKRDRGPK